jgi:hypothetical protein
LAARLPSIESAFVGNAGKHKLVTSADILGGKVSEEALELATAWTLKAVGPVNMTEALDQAEKELRQQKRLLHADHTIPWSLGGRTTWANLQLLGRP